LRAIAILIALLNISLLASAYGVAEKNGDAGNIGVDMRSMERCPVCGDYIFRHQKWVVMLYYEKGGKMKHLAFDGVKEFLKFYFDPEKWGDYPNIRMHIKKIVFRDFENGKPIASHKTWFVIGSDVKGPKGSEFIPFADKERAERFMKRYNGREILRFKEILNILENRNGVRSEI